jgi:hypothetical protein
LLFNFRLMLPLQRPQRLPERGGRRESGRGILVERSREECREPRGARWLELAVVSRKVSATVKRRPESFTAVAPVWAPPLTAKHQASLMPRALTQTTESTG